MRVLWFSFTASGAGKIVNDNTAGCGWISSLEEGIRQVKDITLAVGFFHDQDMPAFESGGVTYYPVQKKNTGFAGKISQRVFNNLYDENPDKIKKVIADFKPDIIHIFGTESGMVAALKQTSVPVIIHLQGLVRPYLSAWFPKGMSQFSILLYSPLKAILFRRGYYYEYGLFKKRAKREDEAIAKAHYFFGRTHWDRNYIELMKSDFRYYHCEEVLRSFFFDYQWKLPQTKTIRLVTVINPHLYKGVEMILETASILKRMAHINFEWHVVGMNNNSEIIPVIEKGCKLLFAENNVVFRGWQVGDKLVEELLNANLFIHPSHIDNSPNSVCEAMLLGMPVIAGNAGGLSSMIKHGEDGLLYNSYDPYELALIIKKSVTQQSYLAELGQNARKRSVARHDIDNIISTVTKAYQEIILENSRSATVQFQNNGVKIS